MLFCLRKVAERGFLTKLFLVLCNAYCNECTKFTMAQDVGHVLLGHWALRKRVPRKR